MKREPGLFAMVYNWYAEPFADSERLALLFGDMHGLVFRRSIHYWQDQPGTANERAYSLTKQRPGTNGGERGSTGSVPILRRPKALFSNPISVPILGGERTPESVSPFSRIRKHPFPARPPPLPDTLPAPNTLRITYGHRRRRRFYDSVDRRNPTHEPKPTERNQTERTIHRSQVCPHAIDSQSECYQAPAYRNRCDTRIY